MNRTERKALVCGMSTAEVNLCGVYQEMLHRMRAGECNLTRDTSPRMLYTTMDCQKLGISTGHREEL